MFRVQGGSSQPHICDMCPCRILMPHVFLMVSGFQGFRVPGVQGFRVPGFQGFRVQGSGVQGIPIQPHVSMLPYLCPISTFSACLCYRLCYCLPRVPVAWTTCTAPCLPLPACLPLLCLCYCLPRVPVAWTTCTTPCVTTATEWTSRTRWHWRACMRWAGAGGGGQGALVSMLG